MKNPLNLILFLCAITFSNLYAQIEEPSEAEMLAFTEKFMNAYNQEDVETIQSMYLDDAVRIDTAGQEIKGAANIAAIFKKTFIHNKTTLTLKHSSIHWADYQHGFVAKGTYEIKGATYVYDIPIHTTGKYANTMFKEKDGTWKIAQSVLTSND